MYEKELKGIEEGNHKVKRNKFFYKGYKIAYEITKFKMIRNFRTAIKNEIITMDMVNDEQNN